MRFEYFDSWLSEDIMSGPNNDKIKLIRRKLDLTTMEAFWEEHSVSFIFSRFGIYFLLNILTEFAYSTELPLQLNRK